MEQGLGGVSKVTRSYFRRAVGVILMYDSNRRETLTDLASWVKTCRKNSAWQPCDDHVMFTLWSNKRSNYGIGLAERDPENFLEAWKLNSKHFYVNTCTGDGIRSNYCKLVNSIHEKMKAGEALEHPRALSSPSSTTVLRDPSPQSQPAVCWC